MMEGGGSADTRVWVSVVWMALGRKALAGCVVCVYVMAKRNGSGGGGKGVWGGWRRASGAGIRW